MVQFNDWCDIVEDRIGTHWLQVLSGRPENLETGIEATAHTIPSHYASEERVARAFERLGKPAAAKLVEGQLPATKNIRSGDIGEIYATEWINSHSGGFQAPVKRLRWRDHREMAMRGEDVIGIFQHAESGRLSFLKTEAKSRVRLTAKVLDEARKGLDNDDGRPSPHALSFISARLFELGESALADAVDDALLKHGVPPDSVTQLLFTFSGNAPNALLSTVLQNYSGEIDQWGVGLTVPEHAAFVEAVFNKVITNANDD